MASSAWGQVILNHIYLQPFGHEQLQSMIMLDLVLWYGANAGLHFPADL
jgi:hypothetical protein